MTILIFLYIYLAFLAIIFLFSLFAIYHILRFGQRNFVTLVMSFLYIAVFAIVLAISTNEILVIDWSEPILPSSSHTQFNSFD